MTAQQKQELVKYRFDKAKETIADVEALVKMQMWNLTVNRLYYACFYAVSALLAANDIFTKSHAGARQMFGLHFVKEGKITSEASMFYGEIFDKRRKGDYEDFIDFTEDDVLILLNPAKKLIGEIEAILFQLPQSGALT